MIQKNNPYFRSAVKNLKWFRNSGIMSDDGGAWGVGERLIVTDGNQALAQIDKTFPAIFYKDGYAIVEQRRADCNFETALLFALSAMFSDNEKDAFTAENILDYLFFRSGLLNRYSDKSIIGGWNWSHIQRYYALWFDDEGWDAAIELIMAKFFPEYEKKYGLREWGCRLSRELLLAFERTGANGFPKECQDPNGIFLGQIDLPHWGVPPLCAMVLWADCGEASADERKRVTASLASYLEYVQRILLGLNASELGYLLLLGGIMGQTGLFRQQGISLLSSVWAALNVKISANKEYGIPPAEHFEAPKGPWLADLIYTLNWDFVGLVLAAFCDPQYLPAAKRLGDQLLKMQDQSSNPVFRGCWRGMFDCRARSYGGGDCYEGGAGSIYSGWTNAPIAIGMFLLGQLVSNRSDFLCSTSMKKEKTK